MPGSNLALRLSPGWRTVPPRTGDYRVLWTRGQHLFIDETDLGRPAPLGLVGGLDCPIAVDQQRGLAYRYCCQETAGRRDYSQIREFDVHTGLSRTACKLPLNQWVVWMCRLISGKGMLCGLVATDQPGARVEITHQLGFFDVNSGGVIRLDLPRDAFSPLDAHPGRREVLFHGIEGFQLISFRGERKRRLAGRNLPAGRGGAFHPTEPLVVLGGGKLVLWDLRDGQLVELRATGQYPLFTRDGRGFWFSESSADLWYYDLETREATRILEIAGYRNPEINYSRPLTMSADGEILALALTRKTRIDPGVKSAGGNGANAGGAPVITNHALCLLKPREREVWHVPERAFNFSVIAC